MWFHSFKLDFENLQGKHLWCFCGPLVALDDIWWNSVYVISTTNLICFEMNGHMTYIKLIKKFKFLVNFRRPVCPLHCRKLVIFLRPLVTLPFSYKNTRFWLVDVCLEKNVGQESRFAVFCHFWAEFCASREDAGWVLGLLSVSPLDVKFELLSFWESPSTGVPFHLIHWNSFPWDPLPTESSFQQIIFPWKPFSIWSVLPPGGGGAIPAGGRLI